MNRKKTIGLFCIALGILLFDLPIYITKPAPTPTQKWGSAIVGLILIVFGLYKIYSAKKN